MKQEIQFRGRGTFPSGVDHAHPTKLGRHSSGRNALLGSPKQCSSGESTVAELFLLSPCGFNVVFNLVLNMVFMSALMCLLMSVFVCFSMLDLHDFECGADFSHVLFEQIS